MTTSSTSFLPDMTGRNVIVTGANSGIGRAAASALAGAGARVVLAVRNTDKGQAAAASMPGQTEVRQLDLASLASIREFAAAWDGELDLLINNAGVMAPPLSRTAEGFELQFGTNHLGHFALSNLLLEHITGRVVTVASGAHIDLGEIGCDAHCHVGGRPESGLALTGTRERCSIRDLRANWGRAVRLHLPTLPGRGRLPGDTDREIGQGLRRSSATARHGAPK